MRYNLIIISLFAICSNLVAADKKDSRVVETVTVTEDAPESSLAQKIKLSKRQTTFNDALLAIGRVGGINIVVAPELSSPERLKMVLALPTEKVTVRQLLDKLCIQINAEWKSSDGKDIILSERKKVNTQTAEETDPFKKKLHLDIEGIPLSQAALKLSEQTGININVPQDISKTKIELSVRGWDIMRILKHLEFMYEIKFQKEEDGSIKLFK